MDLLEPLEPRVLLSGITYLLQGDIDRNGIINGADAAIMARMAVALEPLNMLADLSGDGTVSGVDASLASRMGTTGEGLWFQGRWLENKTPDYVPPLPSPLNAGRWSLGSNTSLMKGAFMLHVTVSPWSAWWTTPPGWKPYHSVRMVSDFSGWIVQPGRRIW